MSKGECCNEKFHQTCSGCCNTACPVYYDQRLRTAEVPATIPFLKKLLLKTFLLCSIPLANTESTNDWKSGQEFADMAMKH